MKWYIAIRKEIPHPIRKVECDNCGTTYSMILKNVYDTNPEICHSVCKTCFQPMSVKNPFYEEVKRFKFKWRV